MPPKLKRRSRKMADSLDFLRKDALVKRLNGVTGGHHIVWSAKDMAMIRDYVMAIPDRVIRDSAPSMRTQKFVDADPAAIRRQVAEVGITARDAQPEDLNYLFTVSSDAVDLVGDVIKPN